MQTFIDPMQPGLLSGRYVDVIHGADPVDGFGKVPEVPGVGATKHDGGHYG